MTYVIDLRSDTTTRPSPEMRRVISEAEVGDDVYDDDPTIHRLQEKAAKMLGKESALFMPSGTMSNAVAIKAHTRPGDEILLDSEAHSMIYEVGMPATIAQVLTRQFRSNKGVPDIEEVEASIHMENLHSPGTSLLVLENTHNRAGGAIIPLEIHEALWELARKRKIPIHLDGARLFNAAVATRTPISDFAAFSTSVTFCLSKGLGCPVGSLLCGTKDFILKSRRIRKMLGGGMRQAGMLAAAGLYALENNVDRLAEDHERARHLAVGIARASEIMLDTLDVPTNMVYFRTKIPASAFVDALKTKYSVLCNATSAHRIRLVTHLDIKDEHIERAIEAICDIGSDSHG